MHKYAFLSPFAVSVAMLLGEAGASEAAQIPVGNDASHQPTTGPTKFDTQRPEGLVLNRVDIPNSLVVATHYSHSSHASHASHCSSYSYCR